MCRDYIRICDCDICDDKEIEFDDNDSAYDDSYYREKNETDDMELDFNN